MKNTNIYNLFLLFIFFPYTSLLFFSPSDIQPWSLIFGLFLIISLIINNKMHFKKEYYILVLSFLIMIINISLQAFIRNDLENYFNIIYKYLIFIVLLTVLLYYQKIPKKILFFSFSIWVIVSNLQAWIKKPLISFLVYRVSYYPTRNLAIGISPEPSFLSKMMLFYIIITEFLYLKKEISYKEKIFIDIFSIEVILLTRSLTGYILLILYYSLKLISLVILKIKTAQFIIKKKVLFVVTVISTLILLNINKIIIFFKNTNLGRAQVILDSFVNKYAPSFLVFLKTDPSFTARLIHFTEPFNSLKRGNILGIGAPKYSTGGIFSLVYENGIIGLFVIVFMIYLTIYNINLTKIFI